MIIDENGRSAHIIKRKAVRTRKRISRNEGQNRTQREVNLFGSKTSSSENWKHLKHSMQGAEKMNGSLEAEVKPEKGSNETGGRSPRPCSCTI